LANPLRVFLLNVPLMKIWPDDLLLFDFLDCFSSMISLKSYDFLEFSFELITTIFSCDVSCLMFRYLLINCSFWFWPKEKLGIVVKAFFILGVL
jgi:hypothetical protein